jgi:cobalamin biosynthesis protein CobD/CbiB
MPAGTGPPVRWSLTYSSRVLAITLDQARTIGIIATTGLVVGAIASFWVIKSLVQKIIVAVLLGLLAFAVWSQRTALQDCADKVRANYERTGTSVVVFDTECSFFGFSVTISDPRPG